MTAGKSPSKSPVKKKIRRTERGDCALVSVKENLNFCLRKDGGSEELRKVWEFLESQAANDAVLTADSREQAERLNILEIECREKESDILDLKAKVAALESGREGQQHVSGDRIASLEVGLSSVQRQQEVVQRQQAAAKGGVILSGLDPVQGGGSAAEKSAKLQHLGREFRRKVIEVATAQGTHLLLWRRWNLSPLEILRGPLDSSAQPPGTAGC